MPNTAAASSSLISHPGTGPCSGDAAPTWHQVPGTPSDHGMDGLRMMGQAQHRGWGWQRLAAWMGLSVGCGGVPTGRGGLALAFAFPGTISAALSSFGREGSLQQMPGRDVPRADSCLLAGTHRAPHSALGLAAGLWGPQRPGVGWDLPRPTKPGGLPDPICVPRAGTQLESGVHPRVLDTPSWAVGAPRVGGGCTVGIPIRHRH